MEGDLHRSLLASESWSVSYGDDVYSDARLLDGIWYFLESARGFVEFPNQAAVVPICKNPTTGQKSATS